MHHIHHLVLDHEYVLDHDTGIDHDTGQIMNTCGWYIFFSFFFVPIYNRFLFVVLSCPYSGTVVNKCEDSLVLRACMGFTTRECSASNKQYV